MGRIAETEPLYRGSMAIQEKAFGRDHPHVATSRHNLGVVLREAGRYDEAEPLLRDAVAIWSATLGSEHPQPARGKRNLAVLLLATSRAEEALAYAQAAFDIHEKTLAGGTCLADQFRAHLRRCARRARASMRSPTSCAGAAARHDAAS